MTEKTFEPHELTEDELSVVTGGHVEASNPYWRGPDFPPDPNYWRHFAA